MRPASRFPDRIEPLGRGADPFVLAFEDEYHLVSSVPGGRGVTVRTAPDVRGLRSAPPQQVWVAGDEGSPTAEWWAPELHVLDGRCWLSVAADDGDNADHRMQVLVADRPTGPYRYLGPLDLPDDRWAIDATVLERAPGERYAVWSGWEGERDGRQDLYIARLRSPTAAVGPRVAICAPELDWERSVGDVGVLVVEGPAALVTDDRILLTYSASGCWTPDYAIGLLVADRDGDLLDPAAWRKREAPLLSADPGRGWYGPGHNAFFRALDGRSTWTAFHAVQDPAGSCGAGRESFACPVSVVGAELSFGAEDGPSEGSRA